MRVIWTRRALGRATDIADSIARDRPEAARRWAVGLFAAASTLRTHALRGRVVPELGRRDIRELQYGAYRVVYRLEPKHVAIVTVRHSRREWDSDEVTE